MSWVDYDGVISAAEAGDPHSMLILAKLYKAGAFGEPQYDEYIYWLKRFFDSPKVADICVYLEDNYDKDPDARSISMPEAYVQEFNLRDDIVEAGVSLGVYYQNSSDQHELEDARGWLVAALDASAWDCLQYTDSRGKKLDVTSLISKITDRMKALGFSTGEENE